MGIQDTIRKYLEKYNGNATEFSRLLYSKDDSRTSGAWRVAFIRFKSDFPKEIPLFDDEPNDLIPYEWDGVWLDLARRLNRQRPDISVKGWEMRIQAARHSGRVRRADKAEFSAEQYIGEGKSDEDIWAAVEKVTAEAIITNQDSRWSEVRFHKDGWIGIAFASDQHIGGKFTDHERMREDAELIRDTDGLYVIHGGDFVDNYIAANKHSPANKQTIRPSQQWQMCKHYLNMFDDKIVGIVAGNHDLWTDMMVDFDPLKGIAEDVGCLYHTNELNIRALVGEQAYHICIRHQRRGNSQVHAGQVVKKMWLDGESDFDIGVVGHTHTPVIENFLRHGLERWAVRPGSYKIIDGWAEGLGFSRDRSSCPMVILSPDKRQILAFPDLRTGIKTLEVLRNG